MHTLVRQRLNSLVRLPFTRNMSETTMKSLLVKNLSIGSDHGGFQMKEEIKKHLAAQHKDIKVHDAGCHEEKRCDYPDMAAAIAEKVTKGDCEAAIFVCGSGIGISIAANKIKGIRCALLHDHWGAKMCRQHNNANAIAIGGRNTGVEIAKDIVSTFLSSEFESGGRHEQRVAKMMKLEE